MRVVNTFFSFIDNAQRAGGNVAPFVGIAINTVSRFLSEYSQAIFGAVIMAIAGWELWSDYCKRSKESWRRINPCYGSDVTEIENNEWQLDAVMDHNTILVVIGNTVTTDLLDRAMAARMRDEVDLLGKKFSKKIGTPNAKRRGVVVTHAALAGETIPKNRELLGICPIICVGGPASNLWTKELIGLGPTCGGLERPRGAGKSLYLHFNRPQVAVWGESSKDTESAVVAYIAEKDGLRAFLEICWLQQESQALKGPTDGKQQMRITAKK
jgi:hypothetical protein